MHKLLFANPKAIEPFSAHAEALRLDLTEFSECLDSDKYTRSVRAIMAEAKKAGVTSTPSFVLARTDLTNPTRVTGLSFIRGAQPFSQFKSLIDSALLDCAPGEDCVESPAPPAELTTN